MASFNGLIERAKETYHGGSSNSSTTSGNTGTAGNYSGLIERAKKKDSDSSVFDRLDRFEFDANNYFRTVYREITGEKRFNAADFFEERKKQAYDLKNRASVLAKQMEATADSLEPESYDSIMKYLSGFNTEVDDILSHYQPSLDSREGMRAYEDEYRAAMERNAQLAKLDKMVDYAFDPGTSHVNFMDAFRKYQSDESYRAVNDSWTDAERFELGQLQKEDPAKARDFAVKVNNYHNAEKTEAERKNIRQQAAGDIWGSSGKALLAGMAGGGDVFERVAENAARGTITERDYITASDFANETTGAIAEHLNQKYGTVDTSGFRDQLNAGMEGLRNAGIDPIYQNGAGFGLVEQGRQIAEGKGVGDLYNVGYSMAQNLLSRYTLGAAGGEAAVLASYFMNSATSAIDNAVRKGATGNQAVLIGVINGALEVATEAIPVSELFNMGPATTFKDFVKAVGLESLEEFVGEGLNSLGSDVADRLIMGDLSEFETRKRQYMEELGMTEEQAHARALMDSVNNILFEGLSGAVSGAMMAGAEVGKNTAKLNALYRNADPNQLIDAGMDTEEGGKAYLLAQKMQQKLDNNQRISANEKRVLAQNTQLMELAAQKAAAEAEATSELSALGQTENLEQLAALVVKSRMGEDLTWRDKRTIRKNQNVQNLLNSTKENTAAAENTEPADVITERVAESPKVSKDGRAIQISTENPVDVQDFATMDNGVATVMLTDGETAAYDDIAFANEQQANQFYAVRSLPGLDTETANKLLHTIQEADAGQDAASVEGIQKAYNMGFYNQDVNELGNTEASVLSPELQQAVYKIGADQKRILENVQQTRTTVTAKPSQGYKKIVIEGNITKKDRSTNRKRKAELAYVDKIADTFAGTIVHVYESFRGKDGKFYYRDSNGVKQKAPNGKYINGEIWLDINAGDNGEGLILNTFAHEMYHHIEKYNKAKANELAAFVSKELGIKNVDAAVEAQIEKARAAGLGEEYFMSGENPMTREQAENEVYARAMSDFVADSLEKVFTQGNPAEAIARLQSEDRDLSDKIKEFVNKWVAKLKKFYEGESISMEGEMVSQLESFEEIQRLFMEAMKGAGENYQNAEADPAVAGQEMSNEEAFLDSATAVHYQIRPPYADGSKAFNAFVDGLNPEAKKTFDLFYGFYQRSRITNTVSVSGKKVKAVNISALYLLAQDWNDMLAKEPKWAAAAKDLADFLPADVRKRMNMNEDGTLNPTTMEKEFKMPSSMAQRLVDALPYESIESAYKLGNKTVTLPDGKARQSVGGEAYRRAILDETRKLFSEGKLRPVGIGTMSKDRWGSLGFLAANGKTGASGDFTTVCPQMMFNRGCWYCYRRAAMEKGVNNKLVANNVWYTGEILRIKDSDISALNKNGGLRIQSFGDWMPHFSAMLADVLYDAELRGLQVKIITKEPSMINYIAALRDQGIGKNLYFNLSADYTIERGPAKQAQGGDSLDTVNPERPYMRDTDNSFWWKRAMTVEEAAKYREKYPWVNTRIVATDVAEFVRGLKDSRVDVVTGYHGNIRGIERIDSTTGARKIEVEALGDAGMPRFAFNPSTGAWFTEYEGKTATHKRLAQAIADNGLQWEYYIKTCCITGRCATCEGKCGALARDFNVKNATNRDTQSVAYWQKQMEYAVEPEFGDLTEVQYSFRGFNKDGIEVYETSDEVKKLSYKDRQKKFLDIMKNEYRGRTAKFVRNGHTYYAAFDDKDISKNIYGDKRSDLKGWKAKINVGADGNIFELVENAQYDGSNPETGKKIAAHKGVGYWDYFIKNVQIGNTVYDLLANVRKKADGAFVYSIQLNENKNKKASPPLGLLSKASIGVTNASGNTVPQTPPTVNAEMNSLRNEKATARDILSQIDPSKRSKSEQWHLEKYQERLKQLSVEEPRLSEIKAQMEALDPVKDKEKLTELREEARMLQISVDALNRKVREQERYDMFKRIVAEERAKTEKKNIRESMREKKRKAIKAMQEEQRVLRNELTGANKMINSMEDEFVKLAKDFEAKKIDLKTMEEQYLDAAKKHGQDMDMWEREFNRLMGVYESLSGKYKNAQNKIEKLEATILRQRQTAKDRVAGRRRTEMVHKIQRKFNELNRILIHGTKHRNVPEGLQPAVAAVLDAINMEVRDIYQRVDTFEATLRRYTERIARATSEAEVERLIEQRNRYAAKGDQFANKMAELKAVYEKIQKDKVPELEMDAGIYDRLMTLFVQVGDTPLGKMSAEQLNVVNEVLDITMANIRNVNELLADARSAGVIEDSKTAMMEVRSVGGGSKARPEIIENIEKFGWGNLKPVQAFEVIGSAVLNRLFKNLRSGEDTLAKDLQEGKNFFRDKWKKYNGSDWDTDKKWKFTSTSGKAFELDLYQIMSLYALSKRDQARDHLRVGGFTFDSQYKVKDEVKVGPLKINAEVKITDASAYNLSDEILGEIIGKLTADQRAFVDSMQAYLSDNMAAKGNEVSLKKYGIRLFKDKDYFPLRVADQYMAKVREQQTGDRKLKNSGFTQEVVPHAKNPVVLSSFMEVWAEHVDEMSLYHSFVLPLDDLSRVLNYHDQYTEESAAGSVMESIRTAYGEAASEYIDNLIRDVNGGSRTDSMANTVNSMISKAKKAQTMASLSVAIQQPSSILRAMAMIDSKYFIGAKVTEKSQGRTWEEIKKHAPIAIIKEKGGFDTNVGKSTVDYLTDTSDYKGLENVTAFFKDEKYRDEVFGLLPAKMDELAWGVIWNAVKRETKDQHPNMDVNGNAFMKLVAERFTDVIVHTQVYDSVFSRSGMMRSKDTGAKMVTSFMAEPTTTANMLAMAIIQAKRGDISKRQVGRVVGSIAASIALNSFLVSFVYAMRDDDEEERFDEKWVRNFWDNVWEGINPLNYIPIARDAWSILQGFDIDRADMSLLDDLRNAFNGLNDEKLSPWKKTEAVLGAVGNIFGVPMKNLLRDGGALAKFITRIGKKSEAKTATGRYIARKGLYLSNGDEMILAIQRGDEDHIQRVFGRYKSQEEAERALQSAIGEKYREGELSAEEAQELLSDYFDRDDENEVYWLLDKWDYMSEYGTSDGYSKMGAIMDAIESGDDYVAEWQRYLEHGSDMSDIRSEISSEYKKRYLKADETGREEIRDKLMSVFRDTGLYESEIEAKFNDWDFESEYDMSYSAYKAAFRDGEVTEHELRGAMKFYGRKQYQIEEDIRSLKEDIAFRDKYGMTLSEMKDAYDNGDIGRNTLINALVYNGMTKTKAQEEVKKRDISNRLGIDYMELDDAYKAGDISRQTLYNSMIEAGSTKREADEAILGYDWLKKNYKKHPDLAIGDAKKFVIKIGDNDEDHTLADYGVTIDHYLQYAKLKPECKGVDADGDGKTDSGTLRDSIFRMIDSLPISDQEKDGLALISYGIKSIRKNAPWHKK